MRKLPPIPPHKSIFGGEKRFTHKLRKYWDFLRYERSFPPEKDINPLDIVEIWLNCFILKANNSCSSDNFEFKYFGSNLIDVFGRDMTGFKTGQIELEEAGYFIDKYERVLATKRPINDEGQIEISEYKTLKYRQILLPLGDDEVNISAILGGMSYKIFDRKKRFTLFRKK